jgi:hypothetical protein
MADQFPGRKEGSAKINGTGRMVLDPLTDVVVRVLVSVRVSGGEFVVHVLRHRKGSEDKQHPHERGNDADSPNRAKLLKNRWHSH